MPEIDITDKIGYTLLKKGIIDFETLEKSLRMKDSDENKKNSSASRGHGGSCYNRVRWTCLNSYENAN